MSAACIFFQRSEIGIEQKVNKNETSEGMFDALLGFRWLRIRSSGLGMEQ